MAESIQSELDSIREKTNEEIAIAKADSPTPTSLSESVEVSTEFVELPIINRLWTVHEGYYRLDENTGFALPLVSVETKRGLTGNLVALLRFSNSILTANDAVMESFSPNLSGRMGSSTVIGDWIMTTLRLFLIRILAFEKRNGCIVFPDIIRCKNTGDYNIIYKIKSEEPPISNDGKHQDQSGIVIEDSGIIKFTTESE